MTKANILAVKTRLSELIERAARGERVVICRHNTPVAELRAVEAQRVEPRPIGTLPGRPTFVVPPSFFEPMPDEDLAAWEGGLPIGPPRAGTARRPRSAGATGGRAQQGDRPARSRAKGSRR